MSKDFFNTEKDVFKILAHINENLLKYVSNEELIKLCKITQNELERDCRFIEYEDLVINYKGEWKDDILIGFSCEGLTMDGFKYLKENAHIGKFLGLWSEMKELINGDLVK